MLGGPEDGQTNRLANPDLWPGPLQRKMRRQQPADGLDEDEMMN